MRGRETVHEFENKKEHMRVVEQDQKLIIRKNKVAKDTLK